MKNSYQTKKVHLLVGRAFIACVLGFIGFSTADLRAEALQRSARPMARPQPQPQQQPKPGQDPKALADEQMDNCEGAYSRAILTCDPFAAGGLDDAQSDAMEQAIVGGGTNLAMIGSSGGNTLDQCNAAANIGQIAGGVQGSRAAGCKFAQEKCITRCKVAISSATATSQTELAAEYKKKLHRCESFEKEVGQAAAQALQFGQMFAQSKLCAQMQEENQKLETLAAPTPTQIDCTAPGASSDPMCLCIVNSSDPACVAGGGGGGAGGGFLNGAGSAGRDFSDKLGVGAAADRLHNDLGDGFGGDTTVGGGGSATSTAGVPQGGGGGPSPLGGGGGGAYGNPAGAAGSPGGIPTESGPSAISGVSGGSGGGSGYSGRSASRGGGGGDGSSSLLEALKKKFNIKDSLPKDDKFVSRGLAGMSQNAASDGITRDGGPSLWQKVERQYRKQTPTLLPPLRGGKPQ